jgi:predicted ATPase
VDERTILDVAAWKGKNEILEEVWSLGRELQVDRSVAKKRIVFNDRYLKKIIALLLFLNICEHLLDCLQDNTWVLENCGN